jgi:hypothetical protein
VLSLYPVLLMAKTAREIPPILKHVEMKIKTTLFVQVFTFFWLCVSYHNMSFEELFPL